MNTKQYTIRGVSERLDRRLRELARKRGQSLNAWVLEVLSRHAEVESSTPHTDLDHLCGKWVNDKAFDDAVADHRKVDKNLWR